MEDRILRIPNTPGRDEDGYRVLRGRHEYVTYPEDSSFRIWYSDVPWFYENHSHSAVEILLTLKGHVDYTADGKKLRVNENDVLFIPPWVPHDLQMGEGSTRLIFLFEPDLIMNMPDVLHKASAFNRVFLLSDRTEAHDEIREMLLKIADVYQEQDFMWNTICYSYMMRIYALLGQNYLTGFRPKKTSSERGEKAIAENAICYINNHFKENLTLDMVAEFAGFSRCYFSRTFKRLTGCSFTDYLTRKRIQASLPLLVETRMTVREIAENCGFGSVATFNRVFRENRKCSPVQFRNLYRKY